MVTGLNFEFIWGLMVRLLGLSRPRIAYQTRLLVYGALASTGLGRVWIDIQIDIDTDISINIYTYIFICLFIFVYTHIHT